MDFVKLKIYFVVRKTLIM